MVAYVYHSVSFVLFDCLQGQMCLQMHFSFWKSSIGLSLGFVYLIVETRQCWFLLPIC